MCDRRHKGVRPGHRLWTSLGGCWCVRRGEQGHRGHCAQTPPAKALSSRCFRRSWWLNPWFSGSHGSPGSSRGPDRSPAPCACPLSGQPPSPAATPMWCFNRKQKIKRLPAMLANGLSSPGTSVYSFKKTKLISLKQGR